MKRFLAAVLLLISSAVSTAAQSPDELIRWVYTSLASANPWAQQGLQYLSAPAQRTHYFTRRMVAFYEANESYGDDLARACVDFGFAVPGNDYDAAEISRTLQVSARTTPERITVEARFSSFGSPAQVTYEFAQEDGFWKIDDIAGEGFRVSQIPCSPKTASAAAASADAFCYRRGDDTLRLDLTPGAPPQLQVSSWQANGHSCSGRMSGQEVAGGWDFPRADGCRLQLRVTPEGGLQLADPDWLCKPGMCGQRAVLDGLNFPRSSQIDCASWVAEDY
ncbi:hypothetical protein [uncultured Roseobacter sp.]|uniref:hypothetical protein n=1 Tax=uncultured Roseobacter sp. TaxID=114847 RepID=UPI00262E69AB|nr:hypothetical protein [uncultured Roseobacter sp.]